MSLLTEFKEFAVKGNVVDLAVGVVIGAAFGKIVNSVVEDLLMPLVGRAVGNVDFSNLYIALSDKVTPGLALSEAKKLGAVFAWGNFVTMTLNFLIISACVFALVKLMNKVKRVEAAASAEPSPTERLLTEIRDALHKRAA